MSNTKAKRARPEAEGQAPKPKRARPEPQPLNLVDDAWGEVARAGGESVACKLMFISKELRRAVSALAPDLRRLRHSWFYYIAGHRALVQGEIMLDKSVKTFERYKVWGRDLLSPSFHPRSRAASGAARRNSSAGRQCTR
jgi:hypothetical protein